MIVLLLIGEDGKVNVMLFLVVVLIEIVLLDFNWYELDEIVI